MLVGEGFSGQAFVELRSGEFSRARGAVNRERRAGSGRRTTGVNVASSRAGRGAGAGRWSEQPFQLLACAVQVGADGADAHVHDAGNLVIRSLFDITQHEAAAVLRSQPSHGALEGGGSPGRCRLDRPVASHRNGPRYYSGTTPGFPIKREIPH